MQPLPIDAYLPDIAQSVVQHSITLIDAPPGSGKTTRVAPHLMRSLAPGKKIYLLQPRRLAARSVATRIAQENGERLGDAIGYSVRFEQQVSRDTQLIVATEGILVRRLQDDVAISDISLVLLDEFHERSLDADLLLAMLRRVQQTLREDLRLVIMSATLDATAMRAGLGDVPIIQVPSRQFPVTIRYRPPSPQVPIVDHVAETLVDIVGQRPDDTLVFLPGAGEIHRCIDLLKKSRLDRDFDLLPLYGAMPIEEQMRAIETGPRQRIVLATNVAETSLTIPGIKTVVDSGLARVLRFSPDVGLDRLVLESICSASATQRAGRAGRVAPGVCFRMWSEASDRARAAFLDPEIRRVDLSGAILQLVAWGESPAADFPWLESPRIDSVDSSMRLLERLDAMEFGKITDVGSRMARLPLHPRLARIAIEAAGRGCLDAACVVAAMLADRDPFDRRDSRPRTGGANIPTYAPRRWDSDCAERLAAIDEFMRTGNDQTVFGTLLRNPLRGIIQSAEQIRRLCGPLIDRSESKSHASDEHEQVASEALLRSLLAGFPDRLAKRRAHGRTQGIMVGGKGIALGPQSGVMDPEFFLCIDVEQKPGDALVRQASRIDLEWLQGSNRMEREELFFHPTQKQVVARRRSLWIDLILNETPCAISDESQCQEVLYAAVQSHWEQTFPSEDPAIGAWIQRVRCLRQWMPELELPAYDEARLREVAYELCRGKRSLEQVRTGPWLDWLSAPLTPQQRAALEREVPAKIEVPSGSWIKIDYEEDKPPVLAVKIQEVFSWRQTPRIAGGRVPLLLHLLAPNQRPQQITDDLASFWRTGYAEVKKELKRRYPKHSWPEDPLSAQATRR